MEGGLVTLGETMALLSSDQVGRLRHASVLRLGVAGAESNVAIGVRRLGVPAAWTGRVGDDELGQLILRELRAERVDVAAAKVDPGAPTGLMLKERRTAELARVVYYRRGSAGSRLAPGDLDEATVTGAGVLHLTGITPALSASARAAVHAAAELRDLTAAADVVFAGDDEAALVVDERDPAGMAGALARLGPRHAVVKRGADGAVAVVDGAVHAVPSVAVRAVDSVGAGDAFVAGYLAELLAGSGPVECLATAAACGAFAVTAPGDWEGFPTRDELELLRRGGTVIR